MHMVHDVLVMAMTSNLAVGLATIEVRPERVESGSLPHTSLILPHKVYSVAQSRLEKWFCRLHSEELDRALGMLEDVLL